ncbi:probable DNA replication complex GINS protein PSF2 [Eurytemora carolleeae]|uniref:probable DNA replication complex GINS protein PSF2 n=1 Tax=Eurytemora carolleeae TaxID=1294199 RepID=UPI000C789769|nr:probable DNA replication complex GINS protein PSF2 [Eurytemora carolleeae]|eukprot:XP_023347555.1 probable DNA replication complex GINS protein PSF2 [Eurytemora affinis]
MEPTEYEFLAENQTVEINPKFTHGVMTFIQGDVGPFKAGRPMNVPLWQAVMLRQSDKCMIVTPEWMDLERLTECKEDERESAVFTQLPAENMFEISNILLDVTSESIKNSDKIRSTLRDIWDIRQSKLRKSVDALIQGEYLHAKINHLQSLELSAFRPILPHAVDQLQRMKVCTEAAARTASVSLNTSSFSRT